jgi:acetylornithine deacetylase/succinyl-diaminopimelate desuccinylase-like protein
MQVAVSEIAAPTGDEGRRAAWVAARLAGYGLADVRIDAAGNVIGRRPGAEDAAPVAVCAHLDTVFPLDTALRVREDGGGSWARASATTAAASPRCSPWPRRSTGAACARGARSTSSPPSARRGSATSAGSSTCSRPGARWPAAVVALDGAGDERIVNRALASRRFRVLFRGPGGHSWAAFGAPNAVHGAARAAAKLAGVVLPREPRTTLSVGRIGGGLSVNSIPDEGWLEVDLRSTSPAHIERYDRELRGAVRAALAEENDRRATGSPALAATVTVIGDRPAGSSPGRPARLDRARRHAPHRPRPELATASTDANVPIHLGVPAITIGAGGRGGDAHTAGEWFENVDGTLGVARALTIVVSAAGLA